MFSLKVEPITPAKAPWITIKAISLQPANKFIIGYTGTMGMANALEYLIEASILLKENTEIHFVLVGDGYLKETLKKQTNGNTNIIFIAKLNKNQLQAMLKQFDICFIGRNDVKLFDYGVSSNKYFDYMLAKKVILESSNLVKDPVELSGCGIIVKPESAKEIVKAILKLYDMKTEDKNNFAVKGFEYVTKYHNYKYLSNLYLEIFNY